MKAYRYSGHPTGWAVALENLAIIEREHLVARAAALAPRFRAGLERLTSLSRVGHVRSLGLIGGVEIVADKTTKALHPPEAQLATRLTDALLDRGLYTRVALDVVCLAPPLVVTEDQLDRIVEIVGEAVLSVVGS